jgi:hypothetical protein
MSKSPIIATLDDMLSKLAEAKQVYQEALRAMEDVSKAIEALANICEDEGIKNKYLSRLEEIMSTQGFKSTIHAVLAEGEAFTPMEIRTLIVAKGKMDLSQYVNPMASIHTTLRRMRAKNEIEEVTNDKGEKAYRFPPGSPGVPLKTQADIADTKNSRAMARKK